MIGLEDFVMYFMRTYTISSYAIRSQIKERYRNAICKSLKDCYLLIRYFETFNQYFEYITLINNKVSVRII